MDKDVKTEILSPAGSLQALYAGIMAGADAVYVGGNKFGARAYADNPDENMLLDAIDYVHLHGKKIYLTVNTLLKNTEIENQLYEYLSQYYECGLDAVIVQDLGVFKFIKENFPGLDIHASTQMVITGVNGASLLKEMGASRIVTAREISLKEISNIHDNVDIEIESFIHGAMCYSYSGQCLFSSILGGRSGNRGRCAGPCRQPYSVYGKKGILNDGDSQYVLSLRDMNTLAILPQIIHAGVYSLKIEGRMKSPEYAAGTVEMYRKYLDKYYSFSSYEEAVEKFSIQKEDMEKLSTLYSRSGSGTGYYSCHNSKKMVSVKKPAYRTDCDEYVSELTEKYVNSSKKYECMGKVELWCHKPCKMTITDSHGNRLEIQGDLVSEAKNRPMTKEDILKQVAKTGNTPFYFSDIEIQMDDGIFIANSQLNELRRRGLEGFKQLLLRPYRRTLEHDRMEGMGEIIVSKEAVFHENKINNGKQNIICSIVSEEQLFEVLKWKQIEEIILSGDFFTPQQLMKNISVSAAAGKKIVIAMPFVFRDAAIRYYNEFFQKLKVQSEISVRFMVRNIDEIGYLRKLGINDFITDYSVYSFNQSAASVLRQLGAGRITYPYELNYKEWKNNPIENGEIIVYGNIPLMVTANCINQTMGSCDKTTKNIILRDRLDKEFPVVNVCNYCYNVIYNNHPLSLLGVSYKIKQLHPNTVRLSFTTETGKETGVIMERFIKAFCDDEKVMENYAYTRGHFNRGVE